MNLITVDPEATWIGIQAKDRQGLLDFIDAYVMRRPHVLYLTVGISACGSTCEYPERDDVPAESVPCPCGSANHAIIRYTGKD